MSKRKVLVVVDTTALHLDWTMNGVRWEQIWSLVRRQLIDLAVPRVVLMESARQLIEHARATREKVHQHETELARQHTMLREVGIHLPIRVTPVHQHADPLSRDDLVAALERKVKRHGGEILPLPDVSHEAVLKRDLDRRKPFHPSGKGYRDALIWESIVERVAQNSEGGQVLFVTANSDDYPTKSGRLSVELLEDLSSHRSSSSLEVVPDLQTLLGMDEVQPLLAVIRDAQQAATKLLSELSWNAEGAEPISEVGDFLGACAYAVGGSRVSDDPHDGSLSLDFGNVDFPDRVREIEVDQVHPHAVTASWRVLDVLSDSRLLIEAKIMADLGFSAQMTSNFFHLQSSRGISGPDWEKDGVVGVGFGNTVWLYFRVTADTLKMGVTGVEFDRAEPVSDSELGEWHDRIFGQDGGAS